MIISMRPHATRQEIDHVCERIGEFGYKVHSIEGEERVVIGVVGVGDVTAQAEQAMANIDLLLREADSSLQDIVKVTVYLVDPRYRESVYRVMGRWLKGVYPVSTGLVVSALARPEWLVEIDAIAVRPAAS